MNFLIVSFLYLFVVCTVFNIAFAEFEYMMIHFCEELF